MSKIKGKFIDYDSATMELVDGKLAAKATSSDGKDVKVSAGDTTPGYLSGKVLGTSGKLVATKTNAGANETLVLSPGADLFDKTTHTTDDISEGSTNKFYTDARADARADAKITAQKGSVDGLASLDSGGKVPASQLPSFVDDVLEVANFAALPGTGSTGIIYVTLDTNLTYRWSGSAYVEISSSLALGETSSTAYRGDRGKAAYDHSQAAHAPSNATSCTKKVEALTLASGDITAKYIDLAQTPISASAVEVTPVGGSAQLYSIDFSVITNGSAVKRLNWASLGLDGILSAGDILVVSYTY